MKAVFRIGEVLNSISRATLFRWSFFWVAAILCILFYGCGWSTNYIVIAYHPQENVIPFEEASNIAVKVKVIDLRTKMAVGLGKSSRYTRGFVGYTDDPIFAKNVLKGIITQATEAELTNRGFKSGENVLVEVELIKFYSYIWEETFGPGIVAEMILHVEVKGLDGTLVFSKLVKGRGESILVGWEENSKIALNGALKEGISELVNDREFIASIIKASVN